MSNVWNADFPDDVIYESGQPYYDAGGGLVSLGMIDDAPKFDPKAEYRNPKFAGKRHRIAGLTRPVGWEDCMIEFNLLQMGAATAALFVPGGTIAGSTITPAPSGATIALADLVPKPTIIWSRGSGGVFGVQFYYGFAEIESIDSKDKDEAKVKVKLYAEMDPNMAGYSTDLCPFYYLTSASFAA